MNSSIRVGYLVIGLIFLGIAAIWWLHDSGAIGTDGLDWLVPTVLLGAGLVGLLATVLRGLTGRGASAIDPVADYESQLSDVTDVTDVTVTTSATDEGDDR
ncbi:MAG: hypothetical protein HZY75_14675 [Nocardioidaceae bacterium]|nr:MAG: hypothetical protein HZY75_14675 [Nocardioidaceae bacterium]